MAGNQKTSTRLAFVSISIRIYLYLVLSQLVRFGALLAPHQSQHLGHSALLRGVQGRALRHNRECNALLPCERDLRCLRNTIHANLFLTYITSALLWILTLFLQVITTESSQAGCITLVIMFQYFYLTNFFWMFVEGLYLYTLVVQTFSSENISFVIYALIGWGCPALCILIWSIAKAFASHLENEHFNGLEIECAWMRESHIDWIFKGPASLAILINLVFLIRIMWVLITKLRSAHTLETRQYYKASKALLVLIPLFGITYLLVLTGPEQGISRNLFEAMRAFLLSTQGFFVALFYCFLNSEVRQTLRHRFIRWRESRNIHRGNSLKNRRHRASKDYSQRSRTESLRCVYAMLPSFSSISPRLSHTFRLN
ncbi:diuretic hormone receptor isoform X6 [Drosophila montana]|uniref:diuretic hormone receptor isoform X6 n=1 Tax=Drosophila montana TaxID=40370 RepID=UPI00313C96DC